MIKRVLAAWLLNQLTPAIADTPDRLQINLLTDIGFTPDWNTAWSAVSGFVCGFRGYAEIVLESVPSDLFSAADDDPYGVALEIHTGNFSFAYNSSVDGNDTETAKWVVLTRATEHDIMVMMPLPGAGKTFAANGDAISVSFKERLSGG